MPPAIFTDRQAKTIGRRYQAGESSSALAVSFRCDKTTITNYLEKLGIARRGVSEASRIYSLDEKVFSRVRKSSAGAYWVGFIMADGCLHKRRYSHLLSVAVSERDKVILESLRWFLGSNQPIQVIKDKRGYEPMATLAVASHRIVADLAKYGIVERKSFSAKVCARLALSADFWRGVVDGDGWLGWGSSQKRKIPVLGLVGSSQMMEQFSVFVKTVAGFSPSVKRMHSIWKVIICGRAAVAVASFLYLRDGPSLSRKKRLAMELIRWRPAPSSPWSKTARVVA